MRLDSVQIVGFKSFCDRQEVSFRGGVTGIVGPNGCGKSNISDAISWVLGEQSAKSLRGSSMEDVIFNGSQARQPLQMAEVNLKVTGIEVTDPDASSEATVSRRLYRSGESEYLMNGQICRLRDVHELFMDTGLGAKAYSIIEQGKIGLILSSRPTDRRALIEEAAGITKYKARRKQTQVKLEASQQNLLRVNDIVHEVEKQLESLKRQAGKARRYRAAREELAAVDRVLFGLRHIAFVAQAEILAARVAEESEREQASGLALETEETRIEARRHDLHEAEARLEEVRARLGELTLGVDRHQGRSGYARQQITETETRAAEAAREHAELSSRVGPLALSLTERKAEAVELAEEQRTVEAEARTVESLVSEAAGRQTAAERDQEKAREVQVAVLGRIATLQNARASAAGSAERASADLLKLTGESDELGRERAKVDATRKAAEERRSASEALREELTTARDRATELGAAARTRADALSREAKAVETERDGLAGRLSSLEEMVSNHAAFDEGVRVLLAERDSLGVLGVVADALETDPEHERVVEAFLGDRLQAVLVADAETALQGVRWLHEHDAGRAAFLPLAQARTRSACGPLAQIAREEARVTGLLSEVYRVSGPHADRIRAALPDALVVRNLEDALALTLKWGPVACATLAGETVRGGMVEGGRDVPGILAPKRQMREVSEQKDRLDSRVALVREHEAEEAATAAAATEEARELSARIHAAEKELVAVGHILSATAEEKLRIDRKATVLETEHRQAEQEREAASLRLTEIEALLGTAEAERSEAALHLSALASAVADARSEAEAAQARLSAARSRFAALRERLMAAETDCRRLARDREELEERIAATEARGAEMATRKEQLAAELTQSERALAEALTDRDRVASDTAVAEDRVREIRTELEATEASMKDRRRERDMLKDALAELEISRARNGADLDHLARECHQAAGITAAAAAASLTDAEKARDTESLDEQAREIRERIERMGAVNVLAVEQAQEYEERHVFLTAQRQDLLDSIAEMDQAIRKIDRASRERFREAFQVINQYFGEIFRQLFGGGTAGLSLLDEEDILESGIDVMAQPPGKRLQNVMLLSGGEKAMTAIALLFAIFQYKPSPFCILDEVDAPLDDANIGRFVKMLEGMKDRTQFVIITHSRKTMEIADQLYGVTMEEPGVSKLVSVRFN